MTHFHEYSTQNGDYIPQISVVLPVYNVGAYIGTALDSIFNQTIQEFQNLV